MKSAPEALVSGREFLLLLDQEASPEELDRPLLHARDAGAPAALLAGLEAARLAALRIRGQLEQHRRREAELAALFDTASDLAALTISSFRPAALGKPAFLRRCGRDDARCLAIAQSLLQETPRSAGNRQRGPIICRPV